MGTKGKTVKLTGDQLDRGLKAIQYHGCSDFFPDPPEFEIINAHWDEFRQLLIGTELVDYAPVQALELAAPKSNFYLRWATLLYPTDLIIFTSLVLAIRKPLEDSRQPLNSNRVFSFRLKGAPVEALYNDHPSHFEFQSHVLSRATSASPNSYIVLADIADFYPRLYQHKVRAAIDAAIYKTKKRDYGFVIEEKLLRGFARDGASYGIPVGPAASRPLAEAALVEIDTVLLSRGIDFARYIDDFVMFSPDRRTAERSLRELGDLLHRQLGLSLQTRKSGILTCAEYVAKARRDDVGEADRAFDELVEDHFYDIDSFGDLTPEQQEEISLLDLEGILSGALSDDEPDYRKVAFILSKLSSLQRPDVAEIVLGNLPKLYPVSHAVRDFFLDFDQLAAIEQKKVAESLLEPILGSKNLSDPPIFYSVWILDIFAHGDGWNHADKLLSIFANTQSDVIRRYAALALGKVGKRAHAVAFRDHFEAASPLTRSAMLLASKVFGSDERAHWKKKLKLTPFEALLFKYA
jgi:Reverse transcriptase (RNA-dependent DNA polymerase)